MSVNNTASQDNTTLGVCDEEQLEGYQGMYVLFAENENLDKVVKEGAEESLNAGQKIQTPLHKSVKVNNTASQINTTLGVCDETQLIDYQGMYVLVAEKENLDKVVKEVVKETSNAERQIQTPLHKCLQSEKKSKKDAKKDFMLKWTQKQNEKLQLEIKFMKEEHKLKMEKLKLEIKRLYES